MDKQTLNQLLIEGVKTGRWIAYPSPEGPRFISPTHPAVTTELAAIALTPQELEAQLIRNDHPTLND